MKTLILTDAKPPLVEVSKLKGKASQVYSVLWSSAIKDVRGDCGGTTTWSIKAIADTLGLTRKTTKVAVDKLLDNGFIQHIGKAHSHDGKYHSIFRVTHPSQLDSVRYAIDVMGSSPSSIRSNLLNNKQEVGMDYICSLC